MIFHSNAVYLYLEGRKIFVNIFRDRKHISSFCRLEISFKSFGILWNINLMYFYWFSINVKVEALLT